MVYWTIAAARTLACGGAVFFDDGSQIHHVAAPR
jgi:hypothetical protein